MARRKKKRKKKETKKGIRQKSVPFNPVIEDLKKLVKEKPQVKAIQDQENQGPTQRKPLELKDEDIFLQAMSDVTPLQDPVKKIPKIPNLDLRPRHPIRDDDLEAVTHLWELVHGSIEMDITFSDEYIEGAVQGFDRKLMQKLKKGKFPVQDYLDLHGLTKQEAEIQVRNFLLRSHQVGYRCVLVVHGRGLNSEDHIPVLKERIPMWLTRGPVRKIVLAFSTARPYDGGTGAIYVLLRRKKGQNYLTV